MTMTDNQPPSPAWTPNPVTPGQQADAIGKAMHAAEVSPAAAPGAAALAASDPVAAEQRRLDNVQVGDDGSRTCFCGAVFTKRAGWGGHVRGHLSAVKSGKPYVYEPKADKPKAKKAKKAKPEPEAAPQPEPPTVEEACTALVSRLAGTTTIDMEHVELVAGWIDHTRAVVDALTPSDTS